MAAESMIERVARAICDNDPTSKPWGELTDSEQSRLKWIARGVLLEIREPTEAMIDAGWNAGAVNENDEWEFGSPESVYTAMIDAALEEKK